MNEPKEDDRQTPEGQFGPEPFIHAPDDQGISLDRLSAAYAETIGKGEDPYEPADARSEPDSEEPLATSAETSAGATEDATRTTHEGLDGVSECGADDADACEISPRTIVEAMLFVGSPNGTPLSTHQLASTMRGVSEREIDELVAELNESYRAEGCAYEIVFQNSGYRSVLREEFQSLRNKFYGRVRQARLSQAAIDVLAIVAYHQGRTREQVDEFRGKPSGSILTQLVRRQLLRFERDQQQPRIRLYHTTDRFLDLFGLDSLADLPQSQELDRSL